LLSNCDVHDVYIAHDVCDVSACDFCYVHVGLDDGDILVMFFMSMKFTVVLMTMIGRDKHDTLTPYCL
jgi:hypothetical protein